MFKFKKSIINRAKQGTFKLPKFSPKQMVLAGVFTLALAGTMGLGLSMRNTTEAASVRDSNRGNSIMNNGSIGCLTVNECYNDIKDNKPSDLKAIYSNFGLSSSEYKRFKDTARPGKAHKSGKVVVDGKIVMTDAWSIGRHQKSYSWKHKVGSKTYHASYSRDVFLSDGLDVLVMFDKNGEAEFVLMNACGNPMKGKKVQVNAKCEQLSKKQVSLNKYEFTTKVSHSSNASVDKVVYYAGGKKIGESKSKSSGYKITHTFTSSTTVTSKVYFKVPGKQTKIVSSSDCQEKIVYKKPFYECKSLKAAVKNEDEEHTTYTLTVQTDQGNGATFKSVDYIVNGNAVAENAGKQHEVKLENGKTHTIVAKVKFSLGGKTVSDECKTTVSPEKPFYACDVLRPEAINEEKTQFRFTVVASFGNGAELTDADFATWKTGDEGNKTVVEGVTQKDDEGNIYHEFEFEADGMERIVEATVNFGVLGSAKSVTCQAQVTPEEAPKCPIPGKENLSPESPECKEDEKPEEPKEEVLGKETELPKTGAASVVGIFASMTGAGAAAHRLIVRRFGR